MKIIGISLVKNEDLFINKVISNILDFCDEIIVLDNFSKDNTIEEIEKINSKKIKIYKVQSPHQTNVFLEKYYSTNTWVFGVDGDELYDPIGLKTFKKELLNKKWNDYWHIKAAQINVFKIESQIASGWSNEYGCRGSGKFYNFQKIKQKYKPFKGERLHGFNKNAIFEESLLLKKKYFNKENFRFLHLCFMNRSSMNKNKFMITSRRPSRWWNRRNDKYIDYKIGQEVKVQISNFF